MKDNFEACLRITLSQEGGFSNDKADHGGRTMRGITQGEYNKWLKRNGHAPADVKDIDDETLQEIYRRSYWDAVRADELPNGLDLCMFDYAVNSGPSRAIKALQMIMGAKINGRLNTVPSSTTPAMIDAYMDNRETFLRRIGVGSQSVFLRGWLSRVRTIRAAALRLSLPHEPATDGPAVLDEGSVGVDVTRLQTALRKLRYPVGAVDGIYGPATRRAVLLFQDKHKLEGTLGVWSPDYWDDLAEASPLMRERAGTTDKELRDAGNSHVMIVTLWQRIMTFLGLGVLAGQGASSLPDTLTGVQAAVAPVRDVFTWASGHGWIVILLILAAGIGFSRYVLIHYVTAYQNFDVQGEQGVQNA
jgi:lysozyme family protein